MGTRTCMYVCIYVDDKFPLNFMVRVLLHSLYIYLWLFPFLDSFFPLYLLQSTSILMHIVLLEICTWLSRFYVCIYQIILSAWVFSCLILNGVALQWSGVHIQLWCILSPLTMQVLASLILFQLPLILQKNKMVLIMADNFLLFWLMDIWFACQTCDGCFVR